MQPTTYIEHAAQNGFEITDVETILSIIASIIIISGTIYRHWNKCKSLEDDFREFNVIYKSKLWFFLMFTLDRQELARCDEDGYTFAHLQNILNDTEVSKRVQMHNLQMYRVINDMVSKSKNCRLLNLTKRKPPYFSTP